MIYHELITTKDNQQGANNVPNKDHSNEVQIMLKLHSSYGKNWHLLEMICEESYNSITESTLLCLVKNSVLSLNNDAWIGEPIEWSIDSHLANARIFSGVIVHCQTYPVHRRLRQYRLIKIKVKSRLHEITQINHSRTWHQQKLSSIISDLCYDVGCNQPIHISFNKNCHIDHQLNLAIQYQQSNWSYLKQLCDDHQIFFWHTNNTLYMANHFSAYRAFQTKLKWSQHDTSDRHGPIYLMREVCISKKQQCQEWIALDYNSRNTHADLLQRWRTGSDKPLGPHYEFPSGITTHDFQLKRVKQSMHSLAPEGYQLSCRTQLPSLALGYVIEIDSDFKLPSIFSNRKILVTRICHRAINYSGLPIDGWHEWLPADWRIINDAAIEHHTTWYDNYIESIPWTQVPYVPALVSKEQGLMAGIHTAFVGGTDGEAYINAKGEIAIYFPWDMNISLLSNSSYIKLNHCTYVRSRCDQNGVQFHPKPGDELMIGFENQRSDRPIIIGSAYHTNNGLPLSFKNNRNLSGICLDQHALYCNNEPQHGHLIMKSMGGMKKTIGNILDKHICTYQQSIEKNWLQLTNKEISIEVNNGDIHLRAKKEITLDTNDTSIQMTPNRITIEAATIGLITPNNRTGNVATIDNQHKCPKKNDDGSPHHGGPIHSGSGDVLIHGKGIARVGDTAQCHGPTDIITSGNTDIKINGQDMAVIDSETQHGGQIYEGATGVSTYQNTSLRANTSIKRINKDVSVRFTLRATDNYESIINSALLNLKACTQHNSDHLDIPTHHLHGRTVVHDVDGGQYNYYLSPQNMELAIISTNDVAQFPYFKTKIDVTQAPNSDINRIDAARCYESKVLWPMMMLNCREDGPEFDKAKAAGAHEYLDDLDIEYFKKNGNNAVLFIHGYNVEVGELGQELDLCDNKKSLITYPTYSSIYRDNEIISSQLGLNSTEKLDDLLKRRTREDQTVNQFSNSFKKISAKGIINWAISMEKKFINNKSNRMKLDERIVNQTSNILENINGQGAFNWAINMEKNLNTATEKFSYNKKEDYKKFTRLLHVTWQGNISKISYIKSVEKALSFVTAERLAVNLVKLIDAGIQVSIIAHSLGNGLLLETMRVLANNYPGKTLRHVFMWQAAVPNNVFFRPKQPKHIIDPWDYQSALDATEKITILSSTNDNILGPFIDDKNKKIDDVPNHIVDQDKPILEWIIGYASELLNINSIYHLAMTLGHEIQTIFEEDTQEQIYRYFLQKNTKLIFTHGDEEKKKKWFKQGKYMPTLRQQVKIANQNSQFTKKIEKKVTAMLDKLKKDLYNRQSRLNLYLKKIIKDSQCHKKNDKYITLIKIWIRTLNSEGKLGHKKNYISQKILQVCFDEVLQIKNIKGLIYLLDMMQHKALKVGSVPAMGVNGIDKHKIPKKYIDKFTTPVIQNQWLYSHSDMKIPSQNVMEYIYKSAIINADEGLDQFGEYF